MESVRRMSRRTPIVQLCKQAFSHPTSTITTMQRSSHTRSYASIADKYHDRLKQRAAAYVASKTRHGGPGTGSKNNDNGREGLRGGKAIEQLRARYAERVKHQTLISPNRPPGIAGDDSSTDPPSKKTTTTIPKVPASGPVKSLASYIDVEKLRLHDAKEIGLLWRARFAESEDTVCAIIPQPVYADMYRTARQNPMFVLPLFRPGQGVEMHFLQWTFPGPVTAHLMVTSLLEYKTRGEYARPHTVFAHHAELAVERGVVLMKGDLSDPRALAPLQATWMVTLLQRFYCPSPADPTAERRAKILGDFNRGIDLDVDALIAEAKAVPGAGEV